MQESYTLEKFNSGRTVVGDAIVELAKMTTVSGF